MAEIIFMDLIYVYKMKYNNNIVTSEKLTENELKHMLY